MDSKLSLGPAVALGLSGAFNTLVGSYLVNKGWPSHLSLASGSKASQPYADYLFSSKGCLVGQVGLIQLGAALTRSPEAALVSAIGTAVGDLFLVAKVSSLLQADYQPHEREPEVRWATVGFAAVEAGVMSYIAYAAAAASGLIGGAATGSDAV